MRDLGREDLNTWLRYLIQRISIESVSWKYPFPTRQDKHSYQLTRKLTFAMELMHLILWYLSEDDLQSCFAEKYDAYWDFDAKSLPERLKVASQELQGCKFVKPEMIGCLRTYKRSSLKQPCSSNNQCIR